MDSRDNINVIQPQSLNELLDLMPVNKTIADNVIRAWQIINNNKYKKIYCGISGGSDSDVMLDICYKCDKDHKITYVYFDTGLEYNATKEHLAWLEQHYDIEIKRYPAWKYGMTIPAAVKKYGQPFINKYASEMIHRLQLHNFEFKNDGLKEYEELIQKYPNCIIALKWWCNYHKGNSSYNIKRNKLLKEFMIENPPTFKIHKMCCDKAKKEVSHKAQKELNADLCITGVRKLEGGIRSTNYKNCYTVKDGDVDQYRPLFWYSNEDKKCYEKHFNIKHSRLYTEYGFVRSGCCGCPFSLTLENELSITKQYEPKLYKAICNVFKDSYGYTEKYKRYRNNVEKST